MAKKYVILNFSDYLTPHSEGTRGTPITTLGATFERRVHKKGGTFHIHHVADLLGDLRLERHGAPFHEVQGLLDTGWIRTLTVEAGVYRSEAWSRLRNDCRDADKIIFSAHGHIDDADNVYCQVGMDSIRCGDIAGVVWFLGLILSLVQRPDPTITLVVCYAARSAKWQKHHVHSLTDSDIRSSLAFQIFSGLSEMFPQVRLTARTGAVSGADRGTSLTSETEEAIIAAETERQEFPGEEGDLLIQRALEAYGELDEALTQSNLTKEERTRLSTQLYRWYNGGYDPNALDGIINTIDQLSESHKWFYVRFLGAIGAAANPAWSETFGAQIKTVKDLAPLRQHLYELGAISRQKMVKYGKFIYQRYFNRVVVSRWVDESLIQVALFNA